MTSSVYQVCSRCPESTLPEAPFHILLPEGCRRFRQVGHSKSILQENPKVKRTLLSDCTNTKCETLQ